MSQISGPTSGGGGGGGTVTSVSGGNNITITGNPAVNPTVNVSGTTNHSVLLGNGTASINSLANGTTGQVLTAVTGADPNWANPAPSAITLTGDTGGALGPSASFTFSGGTTGLSFDGSATTLTTSFAGITANGGAINLATDAGNEAVNIATGGSNNAIVIGNQVGGTQVSINSGSNGIDLETTGALNIASSTSNNAIIFGNNGGGTQVNFHSGSNGFAFDTSGPTSIAYDATDGGLNLGTGANGGRPIVIGNTTGTTSVTINNGSGGTLMPEVFGQTVGVSGIPVVIDNTGLLGTVVSSKRYKDNIVDMGKSSSNLMKLRPVNFTLKKDESNARQWGLIAEEVAQIYPELVSYNKDGNVESVRYNDLPAMLLNELQKLRKEVDELKVRK